MEPRALTLVSPDGMSLIGKAWHRDKARGAVLIIHGMAEHIGRYGHFASFLSEKGFAVYGFDLRGHGRTGEASSSSGVFAAEDGWSVVVSDIDLWINKMASDHPGVPIVLFGHSAGSLLARSYASRYGEKLAALILSGTAGDPGLTGTASRLIASLEASINGRSAPSYILGRLIFKKYAGSVKKRRTDFDWLSRDEQAVDAYMSDPYCGRILSSGFYCDLFKGLRDIHKPSTIRRTPRSLAVYLFSGSKDPVGGFSRGVSSVYKEYRKAGLTNLTLKFYSDGRHEMLNETNRDEVYRDVLAWLNAKIPAPSSEGQAPQG